MEQWWAQFQVRLFEPLALFGFVSQFTFLMRFVVQWWVSEKRGRSTVPVIFWWISLTGGCMLAVYGALRIDPVIMLGQGLAVAIYLRNLILIYRRRARIRRRKTVGLAGLAAKE